MRDLFERLMVEKLSGLSISLSVRQMDQFYEYYEMMIEWNKVMNLTTITELEDVVSKHFADSLSIVNLVDSLGDKHDSIIDIGTGAGFPGIPLKIVYPNLKVVLLDSLNKKVNFLKEVCDKLGLVEVEFLHGRAEDFGRDLAYREQFDFCVSRAVANLATLSEYCLPYVKIGGAFIPYKSGKIDDELSDAKSAIFLVGGKIQNTSSFSLPGTDMDRTLVEIRKISPTSKKYPRKAGLPSKEPLR